MGDNQEHDLKKKYRDFVIQNVIYSENEIGAQQAKSFNPSSEYNQYTYTGIGLFIGGFVLCMTGCLLPIGIVLIIVSIVMYICMPKNLKDEAKHLNEVNQQIQGQIEKNTNIDLPAKHKKLSTEDTMKLMNEYSQAASNYSTDTQVKRMLMDKFLTIFGDFKWDKGHVHYDTKDLIILPDKLALDSDDCMSGLYKDINIKLTEVYYGLNSLVKYAYKHFNFIKLLFPMLIIFFILMMIAQFFDISEGMKAKLFLFYIIFFLTLWGLEFFAPIIFLLIFLVNKDSRGLIIEIDMPKNFKGETVIFENSLSNFVVNKAKIKKFEKTELEDIEFNKKYLTYTTNQVETRYILTTAFIERLKNIKFAFNAKYFRMRFKDNRITIFAEVYKDLFSMVKNNKTDKKVFDELFEEIYSVLSLVDELKLNVKTGL